MDDSVNYISWDLSDLYTSIESKKIANDIEDIDKLSLIFQEKYNGKIQSLNKKEFYEVIIFFENLSEKIEKIRSYVDLLTSENLLDKQNSIKGFFLKEQLQKYESRIIFFILEITGMPFENLKLLVSDKNVSKYYEWLEKIRTFHPYQLEENLEKLFLEKKISGRDSWVRLFDETLASMEINIRDKVYTLDNALDLLSGSSDEYVRREAAESISDEFEKKINLFTYVTNTLIKDKEIEDRWRNLPSVDASRHLSNFIEPEVVESLFNAVKKFYPRISHRYYHLKKKWMKKDKLNFWDRNAALNFSKEKNWTWGQARELVLESYFDFSPTLADIGKSFFTNEWIDALPKNGKVSGAFSHPTIPSAHPYILLNFYGKNRDVMTLAHELGHGIHQVLAAEQGFLLSDTPLILAETASVFGEQLVFQTLLKNISDANEKKDILSAKIEDIINTVIRQISFFDFERKIHMRRRETELTKDEISKLWIQTQQDSLGDAFQLDSQYSNYWCYISHFVHTPFYVYSYAFGDSLVNSLFQVYKNESEGFEGKYLELLRSGGSKNYRELIGMFNLDASNDDFWDNGLKVVENLIDDLVNVEVEA